MRRFKRLVNISEENTEKRLQPVADRNGAIVRAKVRVADVLPIEQSGIDDESFGYALQAHFDFVITNSDHEPLFVVEFDGPTHGKGAAVGNDRRKNELCDFFGLPIVRVNDEHVFGKARGVNYLTWLSESYFAMRALEEAQASGQIPPDEPLDPMFFYSWDGMSKETFPFFLSARARARVQGAYQKGLVRGMFPTSLRAFGRESESAAALVFVEAASGVVLLEESAIFIQGSFGIHRSEAVQEIAVAKLGDRLKEFLSGSAVALSLRDAHRRVVEFIEARAPCSLSFDSAGGSLEVSVTRIGNRETWRVGSVAGEPEYSRVIERP